MVRMHSRIITNTLYQSGSKYDMKEMALPDPNREAARSFQDG
jgi:hypothetical protein